MKDFYDVYNSTLNEKEELPTLFCDMDMVLVDFLKGADKEVGHSFVTMDNAKRWATIHKKKAGDSAWSGDVAMDAPAEVH